MVLSKHVNLYIFQPNLNILAMREYSAEAQAANWPISIIVKEGEIVVDWANSK